LDAVYPGLDTRRVRSPQELREVLSDALAAPGPVLVDVWIDKTEDVLPMVLPGARLDTMIEA
jgi:acetolactate synthase-1/2/3 large subunit